MKIALINGSPKGNNSTSHALLEDLKGYWGEDVETVNFGVSSAAISKEKLEELSEMDVWVLAFPLYIDGIPGHLLSCLIQLEEARLQNRQVHIYGIVNCGFYEGIQAELALKLLRNWSIKAGFLWSGGVGVGGGGGLASMPKVEPGHGPKAPIDKALAAFSDSVLKRKVQENMYVSVAFPRFLYQMGAQIGWRQMVRANGGKSGDLGKIPE